MNPGEQSSGRPARPALPRVVRRELILFGALLLAGLVLVPPAIYQTGQLLLGEYSTEGHGLLHLYGQIYGDLAAGRAIAWLLVLGPWLGVTLVRLFWQPLRRRPRGGRSQPRDSDPSVNSVT